MATYELRTGSTMEYPAGEVLAPDIVTELLALEAAKALAERDWSERSPASMELGIGPAPFSRFILDVSRVQVDITGIDISAEAICAAETNLVGHKRLGELTLLHGDWNGDATFANGPFDCIYFNPPYHLPGRKLRAEFADSPTSAVYTEDPQAQYMDFLPRIVENLAVGGVAIVRYPGDGSVTFAGEDAKVDHDPWIGPAEMERTLVRLIQRSAWMRRVMPSDTKSFMWSSGVEGRRVNAEIFTRIGDDIANAPKIIRDMEEYWGAYQ